MRRLSLVLLLGCVGCAASRGVAPDAPEQAVASESESDEVLRKRITRYVKSTLESVQDCYETHALADDRTAQGQMLVRFNIEPDGRTTEVEVEEVTLRHPATKACIMALVSKWRFPVPMGAEAIPIHYPFFFAPVVVPR